MFRNKILTNTITRFALALLISFSFLALTSSGHVHALVATPGCYTSNSASSSSSSPQTNTYSGPTAACPAAGDSSTDTGGYAVDGSTYCYLLAGNNKAYTQIPCVSLTCQSGSQPADGAGCGVSDPCINSLPRDRLETCSSDPCNNVQVGGTASCNTIVQNYLNPILDFLGAGVGLVITIVIIVGGIQYAASGGDPNAVAAAKKRIANALIALLVFGLLWALLNWIVPGGVFQSTP